MADVHDNVAHNHNMSPIKNNYSKPEFLVKKFLL